jgi:ribosomal protein S25
MLDSTDIAELQDYSEVSSTGHRDIDRINQLMREKKWLKADQEIVKFAKGWLAVSQLCRRHEAEMSIGQELMRHLNGMDAR